ncbi:MAG TPA: Ig-like domain-containing protein [Thermoanaerobaculia bacterium]|nr:Ig-like domain-containing protein [Thermoanaerobaculia bacterium]
MRLNRLAVLSVALLFIALALDAQQLEIHYIDVGWGGSVLLRGPDGTTVLMEAGNTGMGTQYVVPYLKSIGIQPANGLDYIIGGHQHCDHIGGLDEVINAGYNVHIKQYYNGSSYSSSCADGWNAAAATTTAGVPVAMPVGTVIQLGNGAKLTCIARNGSVIGGASIPVTDENDRSIALLIQYHGFDYLWASDLGGGPDSCTGRSTTQLDVETSVINAISPGGAAPMISAGGIDLLHVNHHGSESSTNPTYFNMANPAVAIIGVGAGESAGWDLPRIDVVEHVLLGQSSSCVTAPPTFVLQTEEGNPTGSLTSFAGYCVGNIKVTTDGLNIFTVSADGAVHQGPNELAASGLPRSFTIDDSSGDTTPPTTSITAPANGAVVSGTTSVTASASDNVGVTKVEFYLDGALQSTDTTSPYSWSWDTTTSSSGSHSLTSKAYDAAGNIGTSTAVGVTVSNDAQAPTTSITAPLNGATVVGTTSVTASASDNVGVTKVEFYLDGALKSTDTTSPYSWSWDTTTASNGSHSLTSKAYDAVGNVGTSTAVNVTVNNPTGTDISGWVLTQANATINYTIPAGTVIPANGYVIIARNATKSAFQTFWGVTLASNVVYINTGNTCPQINGSENYTLKNAGGTIIDGPTISMSSSGLQNIARKDPCLAANLTSSWNVGATTAATPGTGAGAGCGHGLVINEFADATGTGNYVYEFVELHNDR